MLGFVLILISFLTLYSYPNWTRVNATKKTESEILIRSWGLSTHSNQTKVTANRATVAKTQAQVILAKIIW